MSWPIAVVFPDNLGAIAAVRELGQAGIRCVVAGPRRGPASRSRFAEFLEVPDLYEDTARWAEALCAWGAKQTLKPVLFASEDAALLAAERHHAELSRVFVKPHPAPGVILDVVDKRRLYAAAERIGVGVPSSREVTDPSEVAGTKPSGWLVKPATRYRLNEQGGVSTFLQATGATKAIGGDPEKAAAEVLGARFPAILQEAVPGPFENLVTIAVSLAKSGRVLDWFAACKQHEYPEPFGDGLIVRTVKDPGLLEPCVRLLRELGYWGICDVEFKRDVRDGQFKLLDANPRTWLWLNLGTRSGHRLLVAAYGQATGIEIPPPSGPPTDAEWVSPRGTMGFLARCYRPGRHGIALPLRLLTGAVSTILGNWWTFRDPLYSRPSDWPRLVRASGRLLRRR